MHALGHALLALAAGMCAKGIATAAGGMDERSMAWPSSSGLAGSFAASASFWALFGAVAATAKLAGGTVASYLQSRMAGDIASDVRVELLDAWLRTYDRAGPGVGTASSELRRSRQRDQGYAPQATIEAIGIVPSAATDGRPSDSNVADVANVAGAQATTLAAMIAEVRDVQLGVERGLLASVRATLQLVPLAIVLAALAPAVAAGALFVFAPFALLIGALRRHWKRGHRRAAAEAARLLEAADDAVRHADLWTTFGAQEKARLHVARLGKTVARRGARLEAAAAAMTGANELLAALVLVAALAMQRAGWVHLDSGRLLPFVITFFLAYRPLRELAEARIAWSRAELSYASFDLPAKEQMEESTKAVQIDTAPSWPLAELSFAGVTSVRAPIEPLTVTIAPGEIVVLSGRTGAGKTSLFRALLGLDPLEGVLRYDGVELTNAPPGPDARPFAWGPQEAPLVAASLEENVQLGRTTASAGSVLAEIGAAHLGRDLTDERLGAGGRALSGGERQWVSLARAVATRMPVLLLDEPTSGLDAAAQEGVLQAIARLRGKRTVILVTHRSEPLAIADRVLRLEEAKTRLGR